jgi:cell division protein FtsL
MSSPPAAPRSAPPRSGRLTGRAAVLAVVLCAIVLSLAYPVREYMAQREQIGQLIAQQQTMLTQVKNLQAEQAKLGQRSYIERLAQQELDMCMPGAQCYVIEGSQSLTSGPRAQPAGPTPWYAKLWRSVQQAGATPGK